MTDIEISQCEHKAVKHLYRLKISDLKKLLYSLKNVMRADNLLQNLMLWHLLYYKYEELSLRIADF